MKKYGFLCCLHEIRLIASGADPNIKDVAGNTPGIYLRNKELLSHGDLMKAVQNSVMIPSAVMRQHAETWQRPPSGKQNNYANNHLMMIVQAGESAEQQRTTSVIMNNTNPVSQKTLDMLKEAYKNLTQDESIWSRILNRLSNNSSYSQVTKQYIKTYLTPRVFSSLSGRRTLYGATLLDVIKFYPQFFIVAPDPHAYAVFKELFLPVIADHSRCNSVAITPLKLQITGEFPTIFVVEMNVVNNC